MEKKCNCKVCEQHRQYEKMTKEELLEVICSLEYDQQFLELDSKAYNTLVSNLPREYRAKLGSIGLAGDIIDHPNKYRLVMEDLSD